MGNGDARKIHITVRSPSSSPGKCSPPPPRGMGWQLKATESKGALKKEDAVFCWHSLPQTDLGHQKREQTSQSNTLTSAIQGHAGKQNAGYLIHPRLHRHMHPDRNPRKQPFLYTGVAQLNYDLPPLSPVLEREPTAGSNPASSSFTVGRKAGRRPPYY